MFKVMDALSVEVRRSELWEDPLLLLTNSCPVQDGSAGRQLEDFQFLSTIALESRAPAGKARGGG